MADEERKRPGLFASPSSTPGERRPFPSASSRAVPVAMTLIGAAIIMVTQAVQRGLIVGVEVSSPAYVVGGVLIVLGVMGIGRREEAPPELPSARNKSGPIAESGREPGDPDEVEVLRETLRQIQEGRARQREDGRR
ncbi:hypothetical protein [Pinisolibacter aquiterrae]|uniref:hypothetical protein n=1 Tax=Pinisolibacter aquiterrae TaxID=2815579 RepID=UPI001C3DEB9E|nr:hypothetical protein [Pinisolibacter aquiterrae]MBV5266442.1 hypothetical protein [Pinisolibacter aquiterrae]MCC8234701.1 hypothetical protein [Pinisolibacter aquiterrae]